jgi:cephalosporin hydroxylase
MSEYEKVKKLYELLSKKPLYNTGSWVSHVEGKTIYNLVKEAESYIECGTANGYSACWAIAGMLDNGRYPNILTWDVIERPKVWDDPDSGVSDDYNDIATVYVEPFHVGWPRTSTVPGPQLYFIDGDHSTQGVLNDWNAVKPRLQAQDKILFHDTGTEQSVRRAIDKIEKTEKGDFKYIECPRGMTLLTNYGTE